MKKIITILLLVFGAFALFQCASGDSPFEAGNDDDDDTGTGSTGITGGTGGTGTGSTGSAPTYYITYNGNSHNGGSVPVDSSAYESGASVTVLADTGSLTKSGFIFDGWNTETDGTGTDYAADATLTMGSADVTLYAKWLAAFSVTYDGNGSTGGTVPVDVNGYLSGAVATALGNTGSLLRTSFAFDGWNTETDGSGTDYAAGASITVTASVTLYAQWIPAYMVYYDGNGSTGGNVPTDTTAYLTSASATVLGNTGNLVQAGYMFVEWNTATDGSGTAYSADDTFTVASADVTLYAQWASSLVGYYNFNNDANDSSTYGNNGTGQSGPAYVAGLSNECLDLDGAGAFVQLVNSDSLDITGSFTFCAWINPDSITNNTRTFIFGKPYMNNFNILDTGLLNCRLSADDSSDVYFSGTTFLSTNEWNHVALVVDFNADTATIYVNGVADATMTPIGISSMSPSSPWNIGAGVWVTPPGLLAGTSGLNTFDGQIDEVLIYAEALTASDISDIHGGAKPYLD